ncbi:MAG: response regulator transcription factor [Lachnospiraceae bacterium]|nr:response regulator transcription factor [Lachnospiraceae bacterium]
MKVLLANEHPLLQNLLHIALERKKEIRIVGEYLEGEAALEAAEKEEPDLVILGLKLPDMSGITLTERLCRQRRDLKILAVTDQEERRFLIPFLLAGGRGYMSRYPSDEEFYRAISDVISGRIYLNGEGISVLADTCKQLLAVKELAACREILEEEVRERLFSKRELSDREKQVLHLYVNGYSSSEIGDVLYMSVNTVETHKKRIKEKLRITRKTDLVRYAKQTGLFRDWD